MNEDQKASPEGSEAPEWLTKLQQESWQAEILISGGAFIGIISLLSSLNSIHGALEFGTKLNPAFVNILFVGFVGFPSIFLAEGFLLHLILRGYWVGLIGMNYVFPKGINLEKLAFRGRFSLLVKAGSNTPYLISLDKLCSLVFAFTFFVVFSLTGFILFSGFIVLLAVAMPLVLPPDAMPGLLRIPAEVFVSIFFLLVLLAGAITLIDFFTFGRLKRVTWFSKIYYPIHYVMSRITLSFLYRRLYYTIASNIRPWYLIAGLGIQILILALLAFRGSGLSEDIKPIKSSNEWDFLSLEGDVVTGRSLQFSLTHIPRLEDELFEEWKKAKKDTTIKSFEGIESTEKLRLIGSVYEIFVDSIQIRNLQWMIQQKRVLSFRTSKMVSRITVNNFENGSHQLIVRVRLKREDYVVDRSDPKLNYYAKAYFFIDR